MDYISREAAIASLCCDCSATRDCRPGERCVDYQRIKEIPAADVRPMVTRDRLISVLRKYFSVGDSYTYELTRVKEAFEIGTMTFDDFEEWTDDNVSDLCGYLMRELFGAEMREVEHD